MRDKSINPRIRPKSAIRDPVPLEIGIISDTHGLVRPELRKELAGVERILHAGDIGKPEVLEELNRIAPVFAVRGNVDKGRWTDALPHAESVEVAPGVSVYLLHNIGSLDLDAGASGFSAVVFGHSHTPSISEIDGVLFLNPGSVGPRRFTLPVTLIRARISGRKIIPKLITLKV